MSLLELLASFVAGDEREEADRTAMLRLADELDQPLSRDQPRAHFTASAFVIDAECGRACLVHHVKLGRLLQPGGHVEAADESLEAAALREAREETGLELSLHPHAPRPFDLDIHEIPERPGEPTHLHLDVRYLLVGRGDPCEGAAWYPIGSTGDGSVDRLAAKAVRYRAARVRLEPLTEAHLEAVSALVDDPGVLRFTRVPEPVPDGFAETWLAAYEAGRREGTRELFAVVDEDDGGFLGVGAVPTIDRETRTLELGYVVAPAARGRGVATAALRLLTDWAFAEAGAERIELLISVENHASKRVAERAGYVREGVLRSAYLKQGRREDTELWSRLETDVVDGR
jgi:RimJ/RimL family protein N-acetyltransferase